jgi:hypothetical protein
MKSYANRGEPVEGHFWRTYRGSKVDYIEAIAGSIRAYEVKYSGASLRRGAETFQRLYGVDVQI